MVSISIRLADTIIARYPDPDDFPYRRWCYSQGYVLAGFEKLWKRTGDARYLDFVRRFVDQHVTQDGGILDFTGESLDDIMAGTMVVAMYEATGERKYKVAAGRIRDAFRDYPRNSDGGFWHGRSLPGEMWIDGVFMGGMFLARYGSGIGDAEYCFGEVTRQILTLAGHCHKGDSGLHLHAYDELRRAAWADPVTGLSPEVWSEGLGWYALILAETLEVLPLDHPQRSSVLEVFIRLLDGLRGAQDARTGLWHQVVDRGDRSDNWLDTSGSAMFVYAIQRAIDLGFASADDLGPVVRRGFAGLATKVAAGEAGLLDVHDACDGLGVQPSYEAYIHYPRTINAKEVVGSVLWAAIAVEKPERG